jgi:hypothetical protein
LAEANGGRLGVAVDWGILESYVIDPHWSEIFVRPDNQRRGCWKILDNNLYSREISNMFD